MHFFQRAVSNTAIASILALAFLSSANAQSQSAPLTPAAFAYESPRYESATFPGAEFPTTDTARSAPVQQKSRALALLYSALIPGMGELYAGDYSTGKYFTSTEIALWLTFAGMEIFGTSVYNDASTYAAIHSGANMGGKSDQFFTDVGNFTNTSQYNTLKAQEGEYNNIYTTPDYFWQWDNDADRTEFRSMHIRANGIYDDTKYVLSAVVVNHVVSIIDALLLVNKVNSGVHLSASPVFYAAGAGAQVNVQYGF